MWNSDRAAQRIPTADSSTVREINRSVILNAIRREQPVSRAGLSRLTGIHRSNISEIVDELIEAGLLSQKRSVPQGRGRAPVLLSLNDESFPVAGISVRTSGVTVAIAGLSGRIREKITFEMPDDPSRFAGELLRRVREAAPRLRVRSIGVSFPGLVDHGKGEVLLCPSMPHYSGAALGPELRRQARAPALVDNDCNLGALAELWLNEKEVADLGDFVFLHIGDVGVGAGIMIDRRLYRGHDQTGVAEFGHMMIDPLGPRCPCGQRGCWELYVTDRATFCRLQPNQPFTPERFHALLGSARTGNERALGAVRETARYLAIGISNIVAGLNPQAIVLAGRIVEAWEFVAEPLLQQLRFPVFPHRVRPATLDAEDLFLQGAVALSLHPVFATGDWRPASTQCADAGIL